MVQLLRVADDRHSGSASNRDCWDSRIFNRGDEMKTREELVQAVVKSRDIFNAALARGSLADAWDVWGDVKEANAALNACYKENT